jgi:N-acetyl-gamma-glutamyl-phosphate reductase
LKAAVLGTTGYTGLVLLRLLAAHPHIDALVGASSSKAGEEAIAVDPGLGMAVLSKMHPTAGRLVTLEEAAKLKPDVVFAALPHLASAELLSPFLGASIVIDLSADFRIKNGKLFEWAYGHPPPRPDLIASSIYGLCEWQRDRIKGSDIIANPGCYPTASLLPLLPLASAGLIGGQIVINALSGVSGAGRRNSDNLLYCQRSESAGAYLPGRSHRHLAEMEEQLNEAHADVRLLFTPHLVPMKRGIHVTIAAQLAKGTAPEQIGNALTSIYAEAPFITLGEDSLPQTADVWGSNRCDIGWRFVDDTVLLFSAIDNLMKGASGQAVQNMNLRFGFEETAGLRTSSVV